MNIRTADRHRSVLILASAYPPDPESGATRPYHFAKHLPSFGYAPSIVSSPLAHALETPDVHRVPSPEQRKGVFSDNLMQLARRLAPYEDRLPWISYAYDKATEIIASKASTVVLSTSPPIASHLAALLLKRNHGLKWIADFRDPLVGNPFRTKRWGKQYDAFLERSIFRHADAIIGNTDEAVEQWKRLYPHWAHKMHAIWNGFDREGESPFHKAPTSSDKHVFAHIGSIYGRRTPDIVLQSLARLLKQNVLAASGFQVLLVGVMDGYPDALALPTYSALREMGCLECTGSAVPRHIAHEAMLGARALLLLDNSHEKRAVQVPAKLFEYIRTGKPILAVTTAEAPCHWILRKSGVAFDCIFPTHTDKEIDEIVWRFLRQPSEPTPPSDWFVRTFDARHRTATLADIMDRLGGQELEDCAEGASSPEFAHSGE